MAFDPASWRSLHFVPGASDRMLEKAASLPADALILDLEDAVAPEGKAEARSRVTAWLDATSTSVTAARLVRVNPLDSPWGVADLDAIVATGVDALVVPKAEDGPGLRALDAALHDRERAAGLPPGTTKLVVIATETPRALLHVEELATGPRVAALTWGAEDLSAALGGRRNRDDGGELLPLYRVARWLTRISAAAAGIPAIDGVYVDFRDLEGLRRECDAAADVGFSGKLTIHPGQIEVVNTAFTPGEDEVNDARALIEAYEAQRGESRGAFAFRGEMVDAPHLARARALLARAQRARPAC